MSEKSYWFSHDYNAGQDPKMVKLQMSMGHEGKGIFWDLVELMYTQGGALKLAEIPTYCFTLRVDISKIMCVINDFDLFKKDENEFWSNSVRKRLELRNEKSLKASKSAKTRWEDANAMRTHSDGNAIKEKKGKEKKGNNTITNVIVFSEEQKKEFDLFQNWIEKNTPSLFSMCEPFTTEQYFEIRDMGYRKRQMTDMCEKMHNNNSLTKKYKSAFITLKNWLKQYGTPQ